jgi:hypothetical protein
MRRTLAKEIGNEERLITDDDCFPIQAGMCVSNEEYLAEERQVRKQYRDSDFHSKILRMTNKRNHLLEATRKAKDLIFVSFMILF